MRPGSGRRCWVGMPTPVELNRHPKQERDEYKENDSFLFRRQKHLFGYRDN